MEKTYYIKFEGYCGSILKVVKVEASTYEEAEKKAIEEYLSDIDISETDESEYKDYQQDEFISSLLTDDYEEEAEENYEDQFGSEMAIRICRANNIPLSQIEEYGSDAYWINDSINNLQDLYDINENFVIPTGDEALIRDYREEILEEDE